MWREQSRRRASSRGSVRGGGCCCCVSGRGRVGWLCRRWPGYACLPQPVASAAILRRPQQLLRVSVTAAALAVPSHAVLCDQAGRGGDGGGGRGESQRRGLPHPGRGRAPGAERLGACGAGRAQGSPLAAGQGSAGPGRRAPGAGGRAGREERGARSGAARCGRGGRRGARQGRVGAAAAAGAGSGCRRSLPALLLGVWRGVSFLLLSSITDAEAAASPRCGSSPALPPCSECWEGGQRPLCSPFRP